MQCNVAVLLLPYVGNSGRTGVGGDVNAIHAGAPEAGQDEKLALLGAVTKAGGARVPAWCRATVVRTCGDSKRTRVVGLVARFLEVGAVDDPAKLGRLGIDVHGGNIVGAGFVGDNAGDVEQLLTRALGGILVEDGGTDDLNYASKHCRALCVPTECICNNASRPAHVGECAVRCVVRQGLTIAPIGTSSTQI